MVMPVLFRFIKAVAAREHEIGLRQQALLQRQQFGRRILEVGQFVHAVIDDAIRHDMLRKGQHHRRVVPADERSRFTCQIKVEQGLQPFSILCPVPICGQLGRDDDHSAGGTCLDMQAGTVQISDVTGFFPEKNPRLRRKTTHQMLRPLKDEVPAKMAEADDYMCCACLY